MKADRRSTAAINRDNNGSVKIDQMKIKYPVIITLLPLLAMFVIVLQGIFSHAQVIAIAKSCVITLILTGAVTFYIKSYAESVLQKQYAVAIITLCYLGSICLLLFIPQPGFMYFWMLGGLVIAMLLDSKLGLLFNFNLVFILGITMGVRLETIILILIISILLSMFSGALKEKSTVVYAAIIILSANITLAFVINNFAFQEMIDYNYLYSFLSIFFVLVTAFFISMLYQKAFKQGVNEETADNRGNLSTSIVVETDTSKQIKSGAAEKASQVIAISADVNKADLDSQRIKENPDSMSAPEVTKDVARTSYEILCDNNNILLGKLKEFSEALYGHAIKIGDLSERAAREIGAKELLAKAGGLYHEIGKLGGKNYIEEGIKIAEDYAFPKELTAILKEHNIKYDKPSSVEAAIVMLSDNVVSTIEYIEKTEDRKFTPNKIIENIFQMRLDKGTFDGAGISLKDYKKLKEFYQAEFSVPKAEVE